MKIRLWKGARVSFVFGFSVTCAGEEHFKRTSRRGSQGFQYVVKGSVFLGLGEADAMAEDMLEQGGWGEVGACLSSREHPSIQAGTSFRNSYPSQWSMRF